MCSSPSQLRGTVRIGGIGTVPNVQPASRLGRRNSASLLLSPVQRPPSHPVNSPHPFPGPYSAAARRRSIRNLSPNTAQLDLHPVTPWTLGLPGPRHWTGHSRLESPEDQKPPNNPPQCSPAASSRSPHRYHGVVQSQLPTARQWNQKCPSSTRGRPSSAATPHPGGNPVPPASRRSDGARSTARAVCGVPSD